MDTDSNSADVYPVYIGVWINWSRGQVLGATLTLPRREADLFIAFTAFFIAFVATRVWRLMCFAIHRSCSQESAQNALYHQHQAILRNSSNPEDGLRLITYVLRANKKSSGRVFPIFTAVIATICVLSFTVAGGFSSYISTAVGTEVLVKSISCGIYPAIHLFDAENPSIGAYHADHISNAANYAQQCYSNDSGGVLDCGRFVTKQIAGKIDKKAACPFRDDICRNASSNIRIDSDYLSSHDHFGLNTPPNNRLLWRYVYHCAPLVTEGYTSHINTSIGQATVYHYGNITGVDGDLDYIQVVKSLEAQNLANEFIVGYSNFDLQYVESTLRACGAATQDGKIIPSSDFLPIDAIFRGDADVDIYFLSGNGVTFSKKSNDPWYRVASTSTNFSLLGVDNFPSLPAYYSSEPASPLGCTSQHQFCHSVSGNRTCGPLAGVFDAAAGMADLLDTTFTDLQVGNVTTKATALATYFIHATADSPLLYLVGQLGPTSLASQRYLSNGFQYFMETDQWQSDVAHWWNIAMAERQQAVLAQAYYTSTDPATLPQFINFTATELKKVCNSQKIRSTEYGSFNLFGLIFVFSVGGSLIATSYLLEPVAAFLYEKWGYKKYEQLEWTSNATLQLQRLAHEEAGFATWSNCTGTAPKTETGELLGSLNLTDPDHPVLKPAPPETKTSHNADVASERPVNMGRPDMPQTDNATSPTVTSSSLPLPFAQPTPVA
ncbi:hypothetical protein F5B22DRAFT_638000 [Xylaria bambusicola]|uniref:uncharacterized protein n=1 Tax=Xylaria bambusicola TaxID=326684 RepID=UPI002008129D|nr:uncharacterized protein F5B22DRAFT_638000 [Xylaria bambusicola]KAI0509524.1 hypothetical protein F5B22DRAFT_638000 [Xylaria bambusicola]